MGRLTRAPASSTALEGTAGSGQGLGGCSTHSRSHAHLGTYSPRDLPIDDEEERQKPGRGGEKTLNEEVKMLKEQKRNGPCRETQ